MTGSPRTPPTGDERPADPSAAGTGVEGSGRAAGGLGRRGFVAGLLAGTVAGATAGAVTGASQDSGGVSPTAPMGVVVLSGPGVDPRGEQDSTSALQRLVDRAPEGARLWLPEGLYLVNGIVLRPGQSLSGPSARTYTGAPTSGARLRARLAEQTAPVLTVGERGSVADIAVEGNGRNQPAVRPVGIGVVVERVTMVDASVGYDARYVSGSVLTACQVHENTVGLQDLVDSIVQSCFVNANVGDGILLSPGANDNTFIGNKIEWNDGHGVHALEALHNVLLGGVLDRNGLTGARFEACAHTTVVGAVFRRNGRLAEESSAEDCHLLHQDCTALVVTGISTNSGADDDGGGRPSPSVAVRAEGGTDVSITGNDLTGRTSPVAIAVGAAGTRNSSLLNAGVAGVQRLSGTQVRVGAADLDLVAGGSASGSFVLDAVDPESPGRAFQLRMVSRDLATGARAAADAAVLVFREGAAVQAALGPVGNTIGAAFGTAVGAHRVSATVTDDGGELTIAVQNTGGGRSRIGLELT
ncbi:right-handed parallel beta-helix repeat-containing protein [Modestobacter sp. VKM Ac-2978]|uniref:right-handed parallel beta-helix repeat-containing protein n=1 Tax=Modestobacter sp. VKM Ac-2978 TaxID=3004132 RepID=UPI0022AA83D5|nr:right-handed parallel beta-helix repeat-containing protein [Modestobacter sp. VKM Ac-2978]MCZ2846987.1 right-handed parallel beta-helix repeat-containing protein [Modestobacter sp. VKM Ac-2978]